MRTRHGNVQVRQTGSRLTAAGMAAVLSVGLLVVTGQPAAAVFTRWDTRTGWAYTDSKRPHDIQVDGTGLAPVGTWTDDQGRRHTSRSYLTFDISRYRGATIDEAVLVTREATVADCTQKPTVELWRTDDVTTRSSWKNPPRERALLDTFTRPDQVACPYTYNEWDATEGLRQAIAEGRSTLTLALRLPAELERDPRQAVHFRNDVGMSVRYNHPPDVPTELRLEPGGKPCATAEPYPWVGRGTLYLSALVTDPDEAVVGNGDRMDATFAVWPVDEPAARTERTTTGTTSDGRHTTTFPADLFEDERAYAWAVRATDGVATSEWSPPCYFRRDLRAPDAPPTVSSVAYPDDDNSHGGVGVPGEFTFGANGVADVAGYRYGLHGASNLDVPASSPGGGATVTITPDRDGWITLRVSSYDRAGNRSAETTYEFRVTDLTPRVGGYLTEVNVPTAFTFQPGMPGVLEYRYQLDGEPAVTVAAGPDGTAAATITTTRGGNRTLTVTSRTVDGFEATTVRQFSVQSGPVVTATVYLPGQVAGGQGIPGVFTFTPRLPDVVQYRYRFGGSYQTVDADDDGRASVTWAPTGLGSVTLQVTSISADGTQSTTTNYSISVRDLTPSVWSSLYNPWVPMGGPGVPDTFVIDSQASEVTEFVYRLNDGAEQTVPASGGSALLTITPDRSGEHVLTVRGRLPDGLLSPEATYTFLVAEPQG